MNTEEGRKKARDALLAKDPDYFRKLGAKGAAAPHTAPTGFASDKVGPDGLTGKERARKLANERKKR